MDSTTRKILEHALGSIARAALVFIGAWLVRRGYVAEDQAAGLEAYAPEVVGVVLTLVGVVWGIVQKYRANIKVNEALAAPSATTRAQFEEMREKGTA